MTNEDIARYAAVAGKLFAGYLDGDRNGIVTSREQVQPLVDAVNTMSPAERKQMGELVQKSMPSTDLSALSREDRSMVEGIADLQRAIYDPEKLQAFCAAPARIDAANKGMNFAIDMVAQMPAAVGRMTPAEQSKATGAMKEQWEQLAPGIRSMIGIGQSFQMDAVMGGIDAGTVSTAVEGFQRGFREAAPGGVAPFDANDICHGLGASAKGKPAQPEQGPAGRGGRPIS